jgi:hypothetical protein
MEEVLQQLWFAVGLMAAFILGAVYWRRQHAPVSIVPTAAPTPPGAIVYRDAPTVRAADSQRVDRARKLVRLRAGESHDVLPPVAGLPPRFRISVKSIVEGSDLEAAHIAVQFSGAQLSCGPLVDETACNEFVIPRASRDEHRSSVFYYHERGDSLEFMRIKLKSANANTGQIELDVMQLHGHWPSRLDLSE